MPQSLSNLLIHVVFSTKGRAAFIDDTVRADLHAYLASIVRHANSECFRVGGTADHVHILSTLSRTTTIAKVIGEAKRNSSKWIKTKGGNLQLFQWQNGYGAFSVSFSKITEVREYISNQMNHHGKLSFQEEYRLFLRKHGLDFDEAHVWD